MADDDKKQKKEPKDDQTPSEESTVPEEPAEEEVVTEESAVPAAPEEPASAPAAPADSSATSSGTDPSGRQLFDITCSSCGKPAQVPFKPSGDRPVFCRDCFMKQKRG